MNKEISNFLITYTKNINHSNGFFIEHLIGVYNILKEINQDEDVCLAGLFHSIYGTDSFKLDLNIKRDEIKKLIVYLDEKDRRRGTNWETVFPWLKEYQNYVV